MASAASSSGVLKDVQVAIVGAGVAGLQCAQTLLKAGVTSVVVLEATSVVGGYETSVVATHCVCGHSRRVCWLAVVLVVSRRVRPDATFMRHGKEIELGAEFLHGDRTMLADIVKDLGLRSWSLCTWAQVSACSDVAPLDANVDACMYVCCMHYLVFLLGRWRSLGGTCSGWRHFILLPR